MEEFENWLASLEQEEASMEAPTELIQFTKDVDFVFQEEKVYKIVVMDIKHQDVVVDTKAFIGVLNITKEEKKEDERYNYFHVVLKNNSYPVGKDIIDSYVLLYLLILDKRIPPRINVLWKYAFEVKLIWIKSPENHGMESIFETENKLQIGRIMEESPFFIELSIFDVTDVTGIDSDQYILTTEQWLSYSSQLAIMPGGSEYLEKFGGIAKLKPSEYRSRYVPEATRIPTFVRTVPKEIPTSEFQLPRRGIHVYDKNDGKLDKEELDILIGYIEKNTSAGFIRQEELTMDFLNRLGSLLNSLSKKPEAKYYIKDFESYVTIFEELKQRVIKMK